MSKILIQLPNRRSSGEPVHVELRATNSILARRPGVARARATSLVKVKSKQPGPWNNARDTGKIKSGGVIE
jgi:hypothetical protein